MSEKDQLEKVERLNARNLLSRVSEGKPLTSEQLNFLRDKIGPAPEEKKQPVDLLARALLLADFVKLSGLDPRRIQQLKKEGHIPDNGRGKYRFEHLRAYVAYLQGLVQRRRIESDSPDKLDLDQERALKEREQRRKLERENALAEGKLVDAAEVDAMNAEVDGIIRSNMLAIPARMAGELAGIEEPREVQLALDQVIRKSLAALEGNLDSE
ncbi:hypothetical protein [Roseibacillus ishigakijimensis]|uniref:Uncharacterized protein n=1 Tax=Roseibacillus ishigakijimensis TaxID=454146 RepID=A0A934VIF6_9BACT|nr:hypothetical protein [Roseibacillus ishigakijimensis]MBK1835023.1 hypothetical protein [Roseibacillus ishigakijimensis]